MKKLKFLFLTILTLSVGLSSCGSDDDDPQSTEKAIIEFSINSVKGTINESKKTVSLTLPYDESVNIKKLSPTVIVSDKATVSPNSDTEVDFSEEVTYTVTAEDGSKQSYTVTVSLTTPSLNNETISAKWEVTTNNSIYTSFEFNKKGNYIVTEKSTKKSSEEPVTHFGSYKVENENTINLIGFGIIKVTSLGQNNFDFTITTESNPTKTLDLSSTKAPEIPTTSQTELLCRTWQMKKILENGVEDEDNDLVVLYSKAGTYFVTWNSPNPDKEGGLAEWKWKNTEQTELYYSWDKWGDGFEEEDDFVTILTLTENSFIMKEVHKEYNNEVETITEIIYELVPYTDTEATTTKRVSAKISTRKGIFGK